LTVAKPDGENDEFVVKYGLEEDGCECGFTKEFKIFEFGMGPC